MRKQAPELGPIAGDPMSVLSTTREPRMRDQGCAPNEVRVRRRCLRIGKVAVVHGAGPQAFHCAASNQVVDVAAYAHRRKNYSGSTYPDHLANPDTYLRGQPGVARRYPASTGLEAEGRVGCPSAFARWSRSGFADPAEQGVSQPKMDPRRADLFEDCNIFRPPLLEESFSVSHAKVTQLSAGGYAPRRWRGGSSEYGQHSDRASASEIGEQRTRRQHSVVEVGGYDHHCRTSILDLVHQSSQQVGHPAVTLPFRSGEILRGMTLSARARSGCPAKSFVLFMRGS